MTAPSRWPPPPSTGVRSIRYYNTGTAGAAYAATELFFADGAGANTYAPTPYVAPGSKATVNLGTSTATTGSGSPMGAGRDPHDSSADPNNIIAPPPVAAIWSQGIRIVNTHATIDLTISFDGVNDHGFVAHGTSVIYQRRHEAGIALKGNGATFVVEAW